MDVHHQHGKGCKRQARMGGKRALVAQSSHYPRLNRSSLLCVAAETLPCLTRRKDKRPGWEKRGFWERCIKGVARWYVNRQRCAALVVCGEHPKQQRKLGREDLKLVVTRCKKGGRPSQCFRLMHCRTIYCLLLNTMVFIFSCVAGCFGWPTRGRAYQLRLPRRFVFLKGVAACVLTSRLSSLSNACGSSSEGTNDPRATGRWVQRRGASRVYHACWVVRCRIGG